MILDIVYNYLFLFLTLSLILWITYYVRNICKCFKKHFLSEMVLIAGIGLSVSIPFYISRQAIKDISYQLEINLDHPSYKIIIYPKSYPLDKEVKIAFKNENSKYISIVIPDENFNVSNITNEIIKYKAQIDVILVE